MPARQAANRLRSMNSSAIPTMNNSAIPTLTPFAAFFPARASEKHAQAKAEKQMTYIFVLYCVAGCELSQPHHRIHSAFDTIERCEQVKRTVESIGTSVWSCERTTF